MKDSIKDTIENNIKDNINYNKKDNFMDIFKDKLKVKKSYGTIVKELLNDLIIKIQKGRRWTKYQI